MKSEFHEKKNIKRTYHESSRLCDICWNIKLLKCARTASAAKPKIESHKNILHTYNIIRIKDDSDFHCVRIPFSSMAVNMLWKIISLQHTRTTKFRDKV